MRARGFFVAGLLLLAACGDGGQRDAAAGRERAPARSATPSTAPDEAMTSSSIENGQQGHADGHATSEPQPVSACLLQDGNRIPDNRLKALGTEPFWAAEVSGRCVTYKTPEDQAGTRIWTTFTGSRDRGEWTGYLEERRFVLRTRPEPGCSDGMSDRRYPISVSLAIGSEQRTGCAAPPGTTDNPQDD